MPEDRTYNITADWFTSAFGLNVHSFLVVYQRAARLRPEHCPLSGLTVTNMEWRIQGILY